MSMERLTKRIDRSVYYTKGKYEETLPSECEIRDVRNILYRLAAYEDTGLEPETVSKIRDVVLDVSGDIDRLRELSQADKEGRCVVLPCKPSDVTVYQLRSKKHAWGVGVSPRHVSCTMVWADGDYSLQHQGQTPCNKKDFDKTWFLTSEAAKAALRREQE